MQRPLFDGIDLKNPSEAEKQAAERYDLSEAERTALVAATTLFELLMIHAQKVAERMNADRITPAHVEIAGARLFEGTQPGGGLQDLIDLFIGGCDPPFPGGG